jgi:ketosteroid isomerase-like protein
MPPGVPPVIERLTAAMNARDLDAFVACFAEDYDSEQPAHPDRAFRGRGQVRENWSQMFAAIPDFGAEIVRAATDGETVWTEWRWSGTQTGGAPFAVAGVVVFGVRAEEIAWARLYVEPVEEAGAGVEAAVRDLSGAAD